MGVGLGTMAGVGGAVGSVVGNAVGGALNPVGAAGQPAAAQPENNMQAFKERVEKLAVMKTAGLISDEEFNSLKAELLKGII